MLRTTQRHANLLFGDTVTRSGNQAVVSESWFLVQQNRVT